MGINILRQKEEPFIMRIKTDNTGISASNQFIFTYDVNFNYRDGEQDFIIDWGDGTFDTAYIPPGIANNTIYTITHTYPVIGEYNISLWGYGSIFYVNTAEAGKIIQIVKWGNAMRFHRFRIGGTFATPCPITSILPNVLDKPSATIDVTSYNSAFRFMRLTSFPLISLNINATFSFAWANTSLLLDFPPNFFDGWQGTIANNAFNASALNQQSVDNILVSINSNGTSGGNLGVNFGTNATPSATGQAAADALRARGWTVLLNGY
jgi:hypothetical protein